MINLELYCFYFDPIDQIINDGLYEGGFKIYIRRRVYSLMLFLTEIIAIVYEVWFCAMRRPIEIEFACNINEDKTGEFYLLQIRPIVETKGVLETDITKTS